jgi:DNA-binding SARP family transcriptional activator
MTISLRIELFGGFDIALATGEPLKLHQPRLQQLLAFLLLNRQQPQSRRYIAFIFWPDSSEKQALANLRKLLHMLGQIVPELPRFLEITTTTMQWRQDAPAQVDIVEFENNLPLGQADGKRVDLSELEQAVNLYRGDLLPHFYDDWLIAPRQQLRERQIAALTALIERYEDKREYQRALQWTKRLQQQIPLQEAVYQRLMRLHLLLGDRASALQAFHQCATLLAEELGVEPGPAIKQLHQRVLQQDELIQTENLPDEPDRLPLAGRIREWRQLQEAWQTAQEGLASMVLVQGEAGIGKTRLAEELVESNRKLGHRVIQTRAYAATDSGAFAPIVDLLRLPQVYAFLQTLDDVWMVEVSRLIPELKATRPALPGPIPMEEPWQQHRFHEAITRCLLGSGQPLLLHFDDLQWCDATSLAWLQFLLEFDRRAPLLVVGTVRNDEIEPTHPLMRLHHQLRRHQRSLSIELQPLSLEATAQLVSSAIGFYPEPTVTNALFGESAGNPLFALELMRSGRFSPETDLTETQQNAEQDRGQLPAKIDAVIRWRLDQLSPDARYLAATAAVIGHSFT